MREPRLSLGMRNVISVVMLGLLAAGFGAVAYRLLFPPPGDGYIVYAEFKDSGGLTQNSDIKIGGVPGGRVVDIDLTDRDTARVKMDLDAGAHPIGAGAIANSRPVNLLGEKYVDMKAGDLSKPQPSGTTIPIARTSRPTELDDVLNILEPDVRSRMRIIINEAGISMAGRSADFNRVLDGLPSALDETRQLVSDFSASNGKLGAAITQSDRVLDAMAGRREKLQDLITSADGALEVTTENRRELASTLRATPAALRQLRSTLGTLEGASTQLRPAAIDLRRATPALARTLDRLPSFAERAQPALDSLEKVSPTLTRLGTRGRPTIRRLLPTSKELDSFAQRSQPLMNTLDRGAFKDLLGLMAGWASTTSQSDGIGQLFRLSPVFDGELISQALERYDFGLSKSRRRSDPSPPAPQRVADPQPPPQAPAPPATKAPPIQVRLPQLPKLPALPKVLSELVDPVKPALDATQKTLTALPDQIFQGLGVTPKTDHSGDARTLLDYLFGDGA